MGAAAYGGRGPKERAVSGDRSIGAAGFRPKHTNVSCPPPPGTIGGHWLKQWTVGGEGRGEQARPEPNADIATP